MRLEPRGSVVQRHADVYDGTGARFLKGWKRCRAHVEHPHRVYFHDGLEALRTVYRLNRSSERQQEKIRTKFEPTTEKTAV